jgi:lysophospholipase L1-like esterase
MRHFLIAALGLIVVACGGGSKPGPAPTPVVQAPQILCPADIKVGSVTGTSQAVTFAAPTVTGGSLPVNVSCSRSSGDAFSLGTTAVSCTANDAAARQAACSFNVTLSGFTLGVTKFEAFGDSLTEGQNGLPLVPAFIDPPNSYPTKLLALLSATFPGQGITMMNRGVSGQLVYETEAVIRDRLPRDRPDAVLLLTGYNDLDPCTGGQANSNACGAATEKVATGVRDCIRRVKESTAGVKFIFVSTLTPPGPVGGKARDRNAILETNRKIRLNVAAERATLVDSYPSFIGHEAEYVSIDGLHLNAAGYQAIADAFFAAIKATVPQTPLPSIR